MSNPGVLFKNTGRFKKAVELFAQKGYSLATMDDIAQAIGVAKGTLYYHYKNKEELYFNLIQHGVYILEDSIKNAVSNETNPVIKVRKLVNAHLDFFNNYAHMAYIFLRELYGNNIRRDLLSGLILGPIRVIAGVLREGKELGVFGIDDEEIAAMAIFGAVSVTAISQGDGNGLLKGKPVSRDLGLFIVKGIGVGYSAKSTKEVEI